MKQWTKTRLNDVIGKTDGRLTVIAYEGSEKVQGIGYRYYFTCRCKCGNIVRHRRLDTLNFHRKKNDKTVVSCGCYRKFKASMRMKKKNRIHGHSNTKLESIWENMKSRCENPNDRNYKNYGAIGIDICSEWHTPKNFYWWARENGYTFGMILERRDKSKGYYPDNCFWVSKGEGSGSIYLSLIQKYEGAGTVITTLSMSNWAKVIGISDAAMSKRLKKYLEGKKTVNDIILEPSKEKKKESDNHIFYIPPEIMQYNRTDKFEESYHD